METNPTVTDSEAATTPAPQPVGPAPATTRRHRPWWVWLLPSGLMALVLYAVNAGGLGTPLYERSDQGANSILIEQARRFTLLIGIYSRTHVNHPGPAYLYPRAWTEQIFWATAHWVPTAFNGQLIAVYAMNAVFVAFVVVIAYGWTQRLRTVLVCLAVVFIFAYAHPPIFSSDWLSYSYVPTYFAFLVAVASVAAGRIKDLWIMVVTGWFLLEGHAAFLLFVPVLSFAALVGLAWPRRHRLGAALRSFFARYRATWISALVISAVFALPMVINLILHWPGPWPKYLSLSGSHGGGHVVPTARQLVTFMLWFWKPLHHGVTPAHVSWLIPLVAYLVAGAATAKFTRGPVRRFLTWLLVVNTLSILLVLVFADKGLTEVNAANYYVCYFYWSAPAIMLLVAGLAVAEALPQKVTITAVAAVVAAAAVVAFGLAPDTNTLNVDNNAFDPALPHAVSVLAARAPGKTIVIRPTHSAWPELVGFLAQAERTNVSACVNDSSWTFMVTSQFICTPQQVANGVPYTFLAVKQAPPGTPVLALMGTTIATNETGLVSGPTG